MKRINKVLNEIALDIITETYTLQRFDKPDIFGKAAGIAIGGGIPLLLTIKSIRNMKRELKNAKTDKERKEIYKRYLPIIGMSALYTAAGGTGGYIAGKSLTKYLPNKWKPSDLIPDILAGQNLLKDRMMRNEKEQIERLSQLLKNKPEPTTFAGKSSKFADEAMLSARKKIVDEYDKISSQDQYDIKKQHDEELKKELENFKNKNY